MRVSKRLSAAAVAVALVLSGCGESTSSSQGSGVKDNNSGTDNPTLPTQFDEAALVSNLVNNVLTPAIEQFNELAVTQQLEVASYCSAEKVQAENTAALKQNAQQSWRNAMIGWQYVELMQMGPLTANSKELKNNIYVWPATGSLCDIDLDVVYFEDGVINGNASNPYNISERTANRKGLTALEHLLFNANLDHNCSSVNDALAPWNSRSTQERAVARCEFAMEVAKDIEAQSNILLSQWTGENGYAAKLVNAGQPGSPFDTPHLALNEISKALFYMTEELKDGKIATPLGLGFPNACGLEACPEAVESPIAEHSKENLLANIRAFRNIFTGNGQDAENTLGFDDFLDAENGSDVKERMLAGLADAEATLLAMNASLKAELAGSAEQVTQTHTDVKKVTDDLKTEFIEKLALELPQTSAGDND
ncbi:MULTISPECIES: imelysin family protein [unclassified Pseudoalteromonas]|uniref:imelysin family protein n=1 Tax=unclassified Pseudoalteromonas TaxID=194690 RepID=UPI0019D1F7BD|nr:imelysin family protein [Pseudoalteromonas sp. JC3]MBR8841449.1 imelysin family protein [Pseudoalteromonas sp. JC3]WJE07473.1 imelysin family protein [Pseudoalteromonas sp. JC3]